MSAFPPTPVSRSSMLSAFEKHYRDQPSNCCGTTSVSAALTALGFSASVTDIFQMSGASLEASLQNGACLGDLHEIAHTYIQRRQLPLEVEAVFMDSLTQEGADLEDALWEELRRQTNTLDGVTILNFNVDLAHGTKGLGGGHFALLASVTVSNTTQFAGERCVVIGDVNPRKYLPYWMVPLKQFIVAMQSLDVSKRSSRSRGFLRLRHNNSLPSTFDSVALKSPTGGYLASFAEAQGTVWQLSGLDLLKKFVHELVGVKITPDQFFRLRYMDLNRLSRGFTLAEMFMCALELLGGLHKPVHTECFHMQARDESAASWRSAPTPTMERFREARVKLASSSSGAALKDKHLDILAQLDLDRAAIAEGLVRYLMQTSDGAFGELRPSEVEGLAKATVRPFGSSTPQQWSIQQVVAVMEERNSTAERNRGFLRLSVQGAPDLVLPTESVPLHMANTIMTGKVLSDKTLTSVVVPGEKQSEKIYIFGYGSLISKQSRALTGESSAMSSSIYCTIHGLERSWNYSEESRPGGPGNGTFVGVTRKARAKCNGIVFPVDLADLPNFDEREKMYERVELPASSVMRVDGTPLSVNDAGTKVYAYVNPSPTPPTVAKPILQSYVDVCILGLLEVSWEFAMEWVQTTVGWTTMRWVNDREAPRYARASPAANVRSAEIDRLLKAALPSGIDVDSRRSSQDLDTCESSQPDEPGKRPNGSMAALVPSNRSSSRLFAPEAMDGYQKIIEHEEGLLELFLEGSAEWVTCVVGDVKALMSDFEHALSFMRAQQVGRNRILEGPFGPSCKVYMDYTASGQSLLFVTQYMHWIKQMFANAHTEDSATGNFMTEGMEAALQSIDRCINAKDNFVSICVGTGCTGAIQRLQQILGIYVPPASWTKLAALVRPGENWERPEGNKRIKVIDAYPAGPDGRPKAAVDNSAPNWLRAREAVKASLRDRGQLPLVIVGGYEHHSNELSWRDGLCDYMRLPLTQSFEFDYATLAAWLPRLRAAWPDRLIIGSFSDCSNVTGMRTDIKRLSSMLRKYACLFFIDYAASGPYTRIDCNPPKDEGAFDACFVSPHKFMGGEGSCGLLVLRKSLYEGKLLPPTFGGGGTVKFVTQDSHAYSDNIIERENAGTPGVLQIMQTAMAFEVKEALRPERIEEKEATLLKDFFGWLKKSFPKEVMVYGHQDPAKRHPIVSFNIVAPHALHPRFVTCLFSDLFGIQTRAGCSCAGPHGVDLLGLTPEEIRGAMGMVIGSDPSDQSEPGIYSAKPGWCRFNLHYTLDKHDINYFKEALSFVVKNGYRFLSVYRMDLMTGSWVYKAPKGGLGSQGDYDYDTGRRQTLHGINSGATPSMPGSPMSNLMRESDIEAEAHKFGLKAALAGASSRIISDSDRAEMLLQQLDRANHILEMLPPVKVAAPASPFPEMLIGGRAFFEVAMTTNHSGLKAAVEVMDRQHSNAAKHLPMLLDSPKKLIRIDINGEKTPKGQDADFDALSFKPVSKAWEEGSASVRPLFEGAHSAETRRIGIEFSSVGHIVEKGHKSTGRKPKMILRDVSGYCRPGEVLFLMGPSGSGKTTLLDCLGGRTARQPLGDILFNGCEATPRVRKSIMRYCMQDPAFHEALTVKETLWIAARLCCTSMEEAQRRVDWVIASLGLQGCQDTKVGGMIFRGISGGQRKRLGIGEQVLAGAPILFLDEPTSALDASAALQIAELMRVLARHNGTTIVCSIHQPSDRVLSCADNVLLLATGGRQTYFGPPQPMQKHFEAALGEAKTPGATAAEWVMEMVSLEVGGEARVQKCIATWSGSSTFSSLSTRAPGASLSMLKPTEASRVAAMCASCRHTRVLFYRAILNTISNPMVVWVRLMMYVALSLVVGTVWWDIGTNLKAGDVNNVGGVLFFVAALQAFMSVSSMPSFLEDKSVFLKERVGGVYNVVSYNVSAFLASAPFVFAIALCCSLIIYFMLSLNGGEGKFTIYLVNLFLTVVCAEAVVFLVASIVPIFIVALAACAFIFGTFMIVQGFFIRRPDIPEGWRWLHYLAFHAYSFRTALYNEFDGRTVLKDLDVAPPVLQNYDGRLVLKNFDFQDEDVFFNCSILILMTVVYRLLATLWQQHFHTGLK